MNNIEVTSLDLLLEKKLNELEDPIKKKKDPNTLLKEVSTFCYKNGFK